MTRFAGQLLLCFVFIGCSTEESEERLLSTYVDVIVIRESVADSATIARRIDSVLTASGYTQESFRNELRAKGQDPHTFTVFYDSVSQRLTRKREATLR